MCQTQAEGGKRCAAHTRPRYDALIAAMDEARSPMGRADARNKVRRTFTADDENAVNVAINHASTTSGYKQVERDLERFRAEGDTKTVMFLSNALRKGEERAEAAKEAATLIRKAREAADRKITKSRVELKRSPRATAEWNMESVYPGVAERWDHEKNKGILPSEVTPNVNGDIWLRCPQGHSWNGGRGNNVVAPIRKGKRYYPLCPECEGRKPRQFQATQQELQSLVSALGDDPEAFEALSPALQYSLMSKMGLLRGGEDSMSRSVGMSIVHGDLTLKDVMLAQDFAAVDGKVRDNLDDEDALGTISDIDISDANDNGRGTPTKVDQVLNSVGVLNTIDADSELAASLAREANEALWERAFANPNDLDSLTDHLNSQRGKSEAADATIDRFVTELEAVRNTPLPDGYVAERLDRDGNPVTLDPSLPQRRFAALVEERRRVMNWSGTGAGKTLSASLAVQGAGAQETLIVCPKPVADQWAHEFRTGFPANTEVRMGLPEAGEDLPPPAPGVNRIWIANYEKFQGDPRDLEARIGPLADRVDAVVFDEIHKAKTADERTTSLRRRALEKFADRAGAANPDLVVVGASATPVVNNLEEAKSVLRLVEGPESKSFATKPTIKNAVAAHHRLASAGVRHLPTYETSLTREDVVVDVTDNVHAIQARINKMRTSDKKATPGKPAPVRPGMMERALLPAKLPKIVEAATANKTSGNGPTLVYTHYTTGMVSPIREALEAKGLRVATYTGDESDAAKTSALQQFRNGQIDVLVGSSTIATGVDGLQHTSHNLLVASMPWTAADDDQLVGRLYRRGQTKNVKATYILTEAKAGKARWSWCKDHRQKRVHFKRDIANAAVDGVLPDGTLDSENKNAERALDGLRSLASTLAKQDAA